MIEMSGSTFSVSSPYLNMGLTAAILNAKIKPNSTNLDQFEVSLTIKINNETSEPVNSFWVFTQMFIDGDLINGGAQWKEETIPAGGGLSTTFNGMAYGVDGKNYYTTNRKGAYRIRVVIKTDTNAYTAITDFVDIKSYGGAVVYNPSKPFPTAVVMSESDYSYYEETAVNDEVIYFLTPDA